MYVLLLRRKPKRCELCIRTHHFMHATGQAILAHLEDGEIDQAREYAQHLSQCGFAFTAAAEIEEMTGDC